jgi:galactosylxylosylprotein 3-beta-galactosyltransferase
MPFFLSFLALACSDFIIAATTTMTTTKPFGLFIGVLSAPQNIDKRNAIRKSWLQDVETAMRDCKAVIRVKFFVGKSTKALLPEGARELAEFNDIVFVDAEDAYLNILEKSVAIFRFAVASSVDFTHVMKTDDDCFVVLDDLCNDLKSSSGIDSVYYGNFAQRAPVRKGTGQWDEPDQNDCMHHLPYALGAGYVMSLNLAQYIVDNRAKLRTFFNEDVAVGFWLAPLRLKRLHREQIYFQAHGGVDFVCRRSFLIQHYMSPSDLEMCWKIRGANSSLT